jgi:hypothetical protein
MKRVSTTVDAGEIVRSVCERLRVYADRKHIKLVVFSTCGGVRVRVRSFVEALFHLVDTAALASLPGSCVIITVRPGPSAVADGVRVERVVISQLACGL